MYAIMRTKKHKRGGGLTVALQHLYRERDTPNADASKTRENIRLAGFSNEENRTESAIGRLESHLKKVTEGGRKIRGDSVVAVEYMLTASPEYWSDDPKVRRDQAKELARRSTKWIADQYPDGKVFAAEVHMDESTPHVSLFVSPTMKKQFKNGEMLTLNAKSVLGGSKKLSAHQTSFYKAVEDLGLKRGVVKSTARHTKVNEFYGQIRKLEADSVTRHQNLLADLSKNEPLVMAGKYYKEQAIAQTKKLALLEAKGAELSTSLKTARHFLRMRKEAFTASVEKSLASGRMDEIREKIEAEYSERLAEVEKREVEMERHSWIVNNYDRENSPSAFMLNERLNKDLNVANECLNTVIQRTCSDLGQVKRALDGIESKEAQMIIQRYVEKTRRNNPDSPDLPENEHNRKGYNPRI